MSVILKLNGICSPYPCKSCQYSSYFLFFLSHYPISNPSFLPLFFLYSLRCDSFKMPVILKVKAVYSPYPFKRPTYFSSSFLFSPSHYPVPKLSFLSLFFLYSLRCRNFEMSFILKVNVICSHYPIFFLLFSLLYPSLSNFQALSSASILPLFFMIR